MRLQQPKNQLFHPFVSLMALVSFTYHIEEDGEVEVDSDALPLAELVETTHQVDGERGLEEGEAWGV